MNTKNSNPDFTGVRHIFHCTFLFDAYDYAAFFVDYGNNIYFGNHCEVNMNCTFLDDNRIVIGDYVWIRGGVIILPGVTIGDNVVIDAGSVVTRDIPSNSVAWGNLCRVMRKTR